MEERGEEGERWCFIKSKRQSLKGFRCGWAESREKIALERDRCTEKGSKYCACVQHTYTTIQYAQHSVHACLTPRRGIQGMSTEAHNQGHRVWP